MGYQTPEFMAKRRKHTAAFKAKVALEALKGIETTQTD